MMDFLDSPFQQSFSFEVKDQPGITDIYFRNEWGHLGWARIHEVSDTESIITSYPPSGVSNKEAIEIIERSVPGVAQEDMEGVQALLYIFSETLRDLPLVEDYLCSDGDVTELGNERLELARTALKKYKARITERQMDEFQMIEDTIIFELRLQGFLPEELYDVDQAPDSSEPARSEQVLMECDKNPSTGKSRRGPKEIFGDDQKKVRIVQEWYAVQHKMSQRKFCLDKSFSVQTLQRAIRYVKDNGLLEDNSASPS